MKKITLLAILMVTFFANAQTVLTEDFESSSEIPTTWGNENLEATGDASQVWTLDNTGWAYYVGGAGVPNTYMYTNAGMAGNYAIFNSDAYGGGAANGTLTSPSFDCSALTRVVLSFNEWFTGGYGGAAFVEASADGGTTWTAALSYPSTTTGLEYGEEIIDITNIVGTSTTAQVRFRYVGDYAYYYAVDNVVVQQPEGSAPGACTSPNPADQAADVLINEYTSPTTGTVYKWVEVAFAAGTGDAASSYDVTYSINPDLSDPVLVVSDYNGSVANNGSLWGTTVAEGWQSNTTYYWKVTAINTVGSADSPIWSFTTGASDPLGVEGSAIEGFKLFPTVVQKELNFTSTDTVEAITIFNILGQKVYTSTPDVKNASVDLSSLQSGVYSVQVKVAGASGSYKIIKE